jgi:hypothetical protein
MELFDDGWDDAEEAYPISNVPLEVRRRFWSETTWSAQLDEQGSCGPVLFADRRAESELRAEMRLSELWNRGRAGIVTSNEFCELSHLITEVDGIRGLLCMDCATLDRPYVSANWALGDTMLCRAHLRFRLGYARVEEDGAA